MTRFVLLLLCATPLVAAPVPKAVKKKPTIDGVWEVVERQNNDNPLFSAGKEFWVITAGEYAIYDGVKDVNAITDPSAKPYRSRWKHTNDDLTAFDTFGNSDNVGTLELDGDTLRIAFGIAKQKVRPAEAKPGQGVAYILFKRVDDPTAKAK